MRSVKAAHSFEIGLEGKCLTIITKKEWRKLKTFLMIILQQRYRNY